LQDHGVSRTIVQHERNGMLASTPEQWIHSLSHLLNDADLRRDLGSAARTTVEEQYSVRAWRDRYLQLFNELISEQQP
jgi:glycosyltransferase involved in cell wall biosynthesis